jgi:hypothetical protein
VISWKHKRLHRNSTFVSLCRGEKSERGRRSVGAPANTFIAMTKTTITITYARCSTDKQDLTAQKAALANLDVHPEDRKQRELTAVTGCRASAATTGENVTFHAAGTLSTWGDSFGSAQRIDRNT